MPEVQKQDPMGEQQDTELFYMLVRMISTNVLLALGRIVPEGQQPPPPDLEAAAVFVDMLAMLEAKTQGKRNQDEDQIIKSALNQLQLAFIELARKQDVEAGGAAARLAQEQTAGAGKPETPKAEPKPAAPAPEKKIETPAPAEPTKEEKVKFRKSYGAE